MIRWKQIVRKKQCDQNSVIDLNHALDGMIIAAGCLTAVDRGGNHGGKIIKTLENKSALKAL